MAWSWLFLLLSSYCTGSLAQFSLIQLPSVSASLRGTVKLSCMHGSSDGTLGTVGWYQQTVGKSPRYLLSYNTDSDKHQGSGIPDRFSASKDSSRRNCYLTVTNIQEEDEGDYYCLAFTAGGTVYVFGGGTQLTVTGGQPSPPTVNLYCPSKEEMTSKGTGTLVCSITGFSPSAIETAWVAGGTPISNGVQTTKPIKDNDKYMASSYLPVTAREWERGNSYTCKVRHEEQDYMKSVSQSQCP